MPLDDLIEESGASSQARFCPGGDVLLLKAQEISRVEMRFQASSLRCERSRSSLGLMYGSLEEIVHFAFDVLPRF